jgi:citrate/tricarballylate utilization protein
MLEVNPSAAGNGGGAASALAGIPVVATTAAAELDRVLTICNACRYCEGFCAVFPAMERRLEFSQGDLHFLANLCHNCGACLHSCQYAPPNAFAVNVPRAMAELRGETYARMAWPAPLATLYRHQGPWIALALAGALALLLFLATRFGASLDQPTSAPGDFYAVIPHGVLVALFGGVALWVMLAFAVGVSRFWRGLPVQPDAVPLASAAAEAAAHAASLRYLDGGGMGCNDASDRPTHWRRRFHHATFYGFLSCFAATCVATVYHYALGWPAPYPFLSLPVALGTLGGIGLLVGPAGLWWLNRRRDPLHGDARQGPMDIGFIALLLATSATGLVLLAVRATSAMPVLLAVHLACVLALFATLPYGKFAHAVYRVAALLKDAIEKRQPRRVVLKVD